MRDTNFGLRSGHFREETKRDESQEREPVRDSAPQSSSKKRSIFREEDDGEEVDQEQYEKLKKIMGFKK